MSIGAPSPAGRGVAIDASPAATSPGPDVEAYLAWMVTERGRSRHTIEAYRRDLDAYQAVLGEDGRGIRDAQSGDIEGFLAALRASGHHETSVARALSAVRGLHRFLVDEGVRPDDPSELVRGPRPALRLPKALSEEEVSALFTHVVGDGPLVLRDRALLEILYGTGARVSEAVGLDLTDIDTGTGLIRLFGKGRKERVVPLGRCARSALDDWMGPGGRPDLVPAQWQRRGDAEALFLNARGGRLGRQGAYTIIRDRAERAGIRHPVSPHTLRHSCATHMLGRGADVRIVQELLGHASVATTQLYTKVAPEHLRRAYLQAHPRAQAPRGSWPLGPGTSSRGAAGLPGKPSR